MGFIKDAKAAVVGKEAQAAVDAGRSVFACRLNVARGDAGMSGEVPGWAEMIASVEDLGWRLDQFSVTTDSKDRPEAYLLFRR